MDTGFPPALLALLGVAIIAAAALAMLWRRAESRLAAREQALEGLRSERESLTSSLARERRARTEQSEELATLRKRVEKAKKRTARAEKGGSDLPLGTASRIADLETRLAEAIERADKLESQLELAKQSEVRMRRRMATQEQLYASMRAELDVKKDRLRAQEEKIQRLEALSVAVRTD